MRERKFLVYDCEPFAVDFVRTSAEVVVIAIESVDTQKQVPRDSPLGRKVERFVTRSIKPTLH